MTFRAGADVMADAQVLALNMIVESLDPDIGPVRMQGNPIKLSALEDAKTRSPAPELDGDRERVLKELEVYVAEVKGGRNET